MTDLVGVLDTKTTASQGSSTAYTCPAGHGAKVKLMYRGVAGSGSTLSISVNNITLFQSGSLTAGHVQYSGYSKLLNNATAAAVLDGSADSVVVAPFQREYMLGPGDEVKYAISGADMSSFQIDVIGAQVENPS